MSDELYIKLVVTVLETVEILQGTGHSGILEHFLKMGRSLGKTENKIGGRALSKNNFLTRLGSYTSLHSLSCCSKMCI